MEAYIKGISYYLPENILDNATLAKEFPEWNEEKIEKKLGIKFRHIAGENETAADLAVKAAENLFTQYSIEREEIDFCLFCSESFDYILPTTSCLIQERLQLSNKMGVLDINLGCSGYIASLAVAKGLIVAGIAKNVLLLTAETYSKYLHPRDKGNRTIFGDGASASLISTEGIAKIGDSSFGTDGKGASNLILKTGGARNRAALNDLSYDDFGNPHSSDYLYMNGPEILNYTLERIPEVTAEVLSKNGLTIEDIDLHVFHQANKYIAGLQRKKLRVPDEKYYCCFEDGGNTVSSTIPIALVHALRDGSIKENTKVLSVAQGLGYTWGGIVLFF
ncbi:MAG: ketoacyl-ACP synthase III [Mediterranea sp.]|jgi:3-oxoacyl-[acyl-carrier-protein] synthase-3|nr:ketoacyl-ACP synthase III [Mediterranea sp.]